MLVGNRTKQTGTLTKGDSKKIGGVGFLEKLLENDKTNSLFICQSRDNLSYCQNDSINCG